MTMLSRRKAAYAALLAMPVALVASRFTTAFAAPMGEIASPERLLGRQDSAAIDLIAYRRHHKAAPAASASPVSSKPTLVGTFGDWGVYVSQGAKSKVCYALGQPNARVPASIKKDGAYVFISNRPGEGVHNEISIMAGLPLKEGTGGARAEIGSTAYDLVAKGQNAFVKNAAEEGQFVGTLKRRGAKLVVKLPTGRSSVTDTYSLAGVQQALERVAKECP